MKYLLVSGFGTSITVDKRRLIIRTPSKKEAIEFYPHQIDYDTIIIDGHAGSISFEAIRWLMKHDITVLTLNWNGNLLASINPKEPNNGKLKVKQYSKYLDHKTRFEIAAKIIDEKIDKSYDLLKELSKYYDCIDVKQIKAAFAVESKIKKSGEVNDIRTYEGRVAAIYWDNLSKVFNVLYPEFHFVGRKNKTYSWNMNASDEINALLNYGYAVLESLCRKQINVIGLESCVGFVHEMDKSKTPLVYDLQELGRWIIDLSIIELLEEKVLGKSDFITTENYHIRLRERTARMLLEKIQCNLNKRVKYKGRNYTYENVLLGNVQDFANYIQDKSRDFAFAVPSIKINRNDNIEIKNALLNMTPEQRRELGINRNTLWYIKKNLVDGKRIKIYEKVKNKIAA